MTAQRQVLITGGAGFIGGYVVKEFASRGWHVLALVHRHVSGDLEAMARAGTATLIAGDATDRPGLVQAVHAALDQRGANLDAMVHCAGRASDVGRREEFRRANFAAVQHLAEIAQDLHADRFVFVSTTDVYGLRDFRGEGEDDLPLANNTGNAYPEFKIQAEEWLRGALPPERYAIIRPAAVWGGGDRTLMPRAVEFLRSSPWIIHFGKWRGRNRWPLAHVRNVAMAVYLAATMPEAAGKAIHVLDSEVTSIDDFYRMVAAVYLPGRVFRSITLPMWVGQCFGGLVSTLSDGLNCTHPLTDPSLYAVYSISAHLDFSNQRLLDLFTAAGYCPVTRDEGLQELLAAVR